MTGEDDADNPYNNDAKDEEEFYAKSPPRNDETNELKDQSLADIYWVLEEIIMFFCTGIILAELTLFSFSWQLDSLGPLDLDIPSVRYQADDILIGDSQIVGAA